MKERYLECGKIVNTHGVRGDVTVESYCDSPAVFCALPAVYFKNGTEMEKRKLLRAGPHKNVILASIEGIDDMDKAIAAKNRILYADREDFSLEDGDYFIADLIGLPVLDADNGTVYGTLTEVTNRGAQDLYTVKTADGNEYYVPAISEFVIRIDPETGVYIRPIEGLLG